MSMEDSAMSIDELKAIYVRFNVPSDQLVQDRELGDKFVAKLRAESSTEMDGEEILQTLVTLRKKGELPRLRR